MLSDLFVWWLACSALGWLIWPLAASIFAHSPGRGYAHARAVGLVSLGYCYWLPGVLGLWPNWNVVLWSVTACLALAGLAMGAYRRVELGAWLRGQWRHVLVTEILFFVVLVFYAWYKTHDPAINHTEEPMDFMFLNAMLRSPRFPPRDPWMAGLDVSYYYLGYLIVAIVSRLSAVPAGVAYNLGLAQTLTLAVVGGYGVLYDLLAGRRGATLWSMLGGLGLAFAGNLEGILEFLHSRGLGGAWFYRWLDIPGLSEAPTSGTWLPHDPWWWWRASRIISDPNILLRPATVIAEFPAFSLTLGDMHPHVMVLPFLLLALGLAGEVYRSAQKTPLVGWWRQAGFWIMPLFLGALGMLNSWDLPTVLLLAGLAFAMGRWRGLADGQHWLRDVALWGAWLGLGSVLLYWPFFRDLSSQAQGIGLVYYAKTPLKQYLVHFAPWMIPILAEGVAAWRSLDRADRRAARWLWLALLLFPWLVTLLAGGWGRFLFGLVTLVLRGPWLLLLQSTLLAVLLASLWRSLVRLEVQSGDSGGGVKATQDDLAIWARLLLLLGLGLTYATEFVYLRDFFDTRMNTMFKFYYQAWVLLGMGAVLAAYRLAWRRGPGRWVVAGAAVILCACLLYPLAAGITRARAYTGPRTLDGTAYLSQDDSAVYGAYRWLKENAGPRDALVEAVGKDYDADHNLLSAWTGVPTILGWPGHETQWRGETREVEKRTEDVERLYRSTDRDEILQIMARYGCTILHVGPTEQEVYGIDQERLEWYAGFLTPVYEAGKVILYRVPGSGAH